MAKNDKHDDEAERRRLQEYIFSLEETQERAKILFAEHARLKDSHKEFAKHVPLGFLTIDRAGRILEVNHTLLEILGSSEAQIAESINVLEHPPLIEAGVSDLLRRCMETGRVISAEGPYSSEWGESLYLREFVMPVLDAEGKVCGCRAAVQDISNEMHAEEALRESEERYRLLTQNSLTGIFLLQDGAFSFVNERMAQMFGYTPKEMIGRAFEELIHPEERRKWPDRDLSDFPTGDTEPACEFRGVCKDETTKWFHVLASAIPLGHGNAVIGNVADITLRKLAEQELKESRQKYKELYKEAKKSEDLYRSLLDASPDAVIVYDLQGRVQYANNSFTRIFGWTLDEVRCRRTPFVPDSEREATRSAIKSVVRDDIPCNNFETRRFTKDGRVLDVSISGYRYHDHQGNPLGMLVVISDVTERKRLEDQLRQAAKMEAIGRLAGGIAHDFNNLLTAIIGYANLLKQSIPERDANSAKVLQIGRAAEHAAGLTRQLLAFSRKQMLEVKTLDLNKVIEGFEDVLRRLIGERIEFVTVFRSHLGKVNADPGQIEQVLMNLVINARDAMPDGGTLTVETANMFLDEQGVRSRSELRPGPYVLVSVSDTGLGMDSRTISRVFDPFFTTKDKSSSTGLGLSTVYGIVKQHGGHVEVISEPGAGTTFHVYLQEAAEVLESNEAAGPPPSQPKGTETVLVVEDEDMVRDLACEVLKILGYETLNASNPSDALTVCERHEGKIHLLLTDVVLPQMDGRALFHHVSSTMPDIKVLYMSGYTDDAIGEHGVLGRDVHFLQKPFTLDVLAQKVREVLDTQDHVPI